MGFWRIYSENILIFTKMQAYNTEFEAKME